MTAPVAPVLLRRGVRVSVVKGPRVGREGVVIGFRIRVGDPLTVVVEYRPGVVGLHAPAELAVRGLARLAGPAPSPPGDGRFVVPRPVVEPVEYQLPLAARL